MPDIAAWNKCDNKCVMCTNGRAFPAQDTAQYRLRGQVKKLEEHLAGKQVYAKGGGGGAVTLTGGEPALHPEFFQLLAYFRRRLPGAQLTLLTNGRRFSSRAFAARFLKVASPPFSVAVPLHGPDAASHDAVTGVKGSFAQAVRGLENLLAGGKRLQVEVRLVLHRLNIGRLPALLRLAGQKFGAAENFRAVAIHYELEGEALKNAKRLELKLSDSARALAACAPLLRGLRDFRLYHFPRCVLQPELRRLARVTQPKEERVYPPGKCSGCRLRRGCPGLMAAYFERFGDSELKPVKR
jgi:MoaA/NifB/PqqE/SkfB family radical SAM enzyme